MLLCVILFFLPPIEGMDGY